MSVLGIGTIGIDIFCVGSFCTIPCLQAGTVLTDHTEQREGHSWEPAMWLCGTCLGQQLCESTYSNRCKNMLLLLSFCAFQDLTLVTIFTGWDLLCCEADCTVSVCFSCKTNPVHTALFLLKAVFGPTLF